MMNYLKSEWYRIVRGKEIYILTGVLCAIVLAANLLMYAMTFVEDGFPYATVRFSLSNLLGMLPLLFVLAGVLVAMLYADDRETGVFKNALACGYSRTILFAGKCIVSFAVGLLCMAVVLVVYIGSAVLLLEGPAAEPVALLLTAIAAALPSTAAIVVLVVGLYGFFPKTDVAIVVFAAIVFVVPPVLSVLGLKFELVAEFAQWVPGVIFGNEVSEVFTGGTLPWDKPFGWARCLLSGFLWLILFAATGLWRARRVEL